MAVPQVLRKLRDNRLLSGAAVYLAANVINAAIPLVLLPVLTRHLSPSEYGQVAMFQALLAALGAFVGLNVAGLARRKYYDDEGPQDLKHFIAACLQILLVSTGIVFVLVFALRYPLSGVLGLKPEWLLLAVPAAAMSGVIQIRLGQWQVRQQPYKYGALQISQSLLNMVLSLVLVVVLLQGAKGRIEAQIWATGLFALVALLLLRKDALFAFFVWKPAHLKEALWFGVPLIPHIGGAFLLNAVDRFVINAELGLSEAGIYMVAVQLASAFPLVLTAVNNAYVPWLFKRLKRDDDAEKRQTVRYTYAWFAVLLLVAAVAFVVGPLLVRWIAGDQYATAGAIIGWLALGQAFNGMYLMVTNYIMYSKKTGLLSLTTISCGALNVLLLVMLVRWLGLEGASIAFCVTMAIRFLLTWSVAQRRHPMPWFSFTK